MRTRRRGGGAATLLGVEPMVFPAPGKRCCWGCCVDVEDAGTEGPASLSSPCGVSNMRALSGNSCSDKNCTSRPWMRSTFLPKSMHAWCALSMSSPRSRSTSRPYKWRTLELWNIPSEHGESHLHDRKCAREVHVGHLHLGAVHTTEDLCSPNTSSDARKTLV